MFTERRPGAHRSISTSGRPVAASASIVSGSMKPATAIASGACGRIWRSTSSFGPTVSSVGTMPRSRQASSTPCSTCEKNGLAGKRLCWRCSRKVSRRMRGRNCAWS